MKKKVKPEGRRHGTEPVPLASQDLLHPDFYQSIAAILHTARANAYRAVNFAMVEAYWNIGRRIVEEEQQGESRAEYGQALLAKLASRLTRDFGAGFSERSLRHFRQFYLEFPIRNALRSELRWTHYRLLMRLENRVARTWYLNEAAEQNWSTRALERQVHSLYYERLLMSRDKSPVIEEMHEQTATLAPDPQDFIKDPYVLEFLGLKDNASFRESDLEKAIIDKLQAFMLELGICMKRLKCISMACWKTRNQSRNLILLLNISL